MVKRLAITGSVMVPGFAAEGVVVYHEHAKQYFKKTCEGDEKPKEAK
jgi:hypothetical protein